MFVEILLKHGADPNLKGGKFGTPLKARKKKDINRVVKLLLECGAKDEKRETGDLYIPYIYL
jgi:hypothetical protein